MTYKNLVFNPDKLIQYKELEIKIASIYENQDQSLFRKVKAEALLEDFQDLDTKEKAPAKAAVKDLKEQIDKGTKRVTEKVKEIHQNFSKVIIKGAGVEVENLYLSFMKRF